VKVVLRTVDVGQTMTPAGSALARLCDLCGRHNIRTRREGAVDVCFYCSMGLDQLPVITEFHLTPATATVMVAFQDGIRVLVSRLQLSEAYSPAAALQEVYAEGSSEAP
jgi:hypothetical protein